MSNAAEEYKEMLKRRAEELRNIRDFVKGQNPHGGGSLEEIIAETEKKINETEVHTEGLYPNIYEQCSLNLNSAVNDMNTVYEDIRDDIREGHEDADGNVPPEMEIVAALLTVATILRSGQDTDL